MASKTVSLKLLIDTKGNRVLFAESAKDFVDFLFNIPSLPVGTIIRLLPKQGMVGSLGNLYGSIENLSDTYMLPNRSKDSILNPEVVSSAANLRLLLPNIGSSAATTTNLFYKCQSARYSNCNTYLTTDPSARCPQCSDVMCRTMTIVEPQKNQSLSSSSDQEGGYVKGVVTYMIMDDLAVMPMSTISSITILNKFNIKDVGALEEKVVELTMDEAVKLLKAALQSKNVLTDVFLKKNHKNLKSETNLGTQTEDISRERTKETAMGQEELIVVEN